ncbi:shikimate kinase [Dialister pneumosintes]|uniref:Shikimate kinase n=1 Tax=Dialister pneumosintes TaxID=39950 RepID=A0ABX9MCN2_9FIRM|nr:shikimate kinase [Dialister pneumosintes]RID94617.1 shikimate kinase [Dialister pneumosintes]
MHRKPITKNIFLIGMPGAGKSTIGKILSENLFLPFYDADIYLESSIGKSISSLFIQGEDIFRDIETEILKKLVLKKAIIATGGGVIVRKENRELLKKEGFVFFIDRKIEDIKKDIQKEYRPLLRKGVSLESLYEERFPLYKEVADFHILNKVRISEVIDEIQEKIKQLHILQKV